MTTEASLNRLYDSHMASIKRTGSELMVALEAPRRRTVREETASTPFRKEHTVKYKLIDKKAVPVDDLIDWAQWMETADTVVCQTETPFSLWLWLWRWLLSWLPGNTALRDPVKVSTVFLGLDHGFDGDGPILFETMVFGGAHDGEQDRYQTWGAAVSGHQRMVRLVRGGS